MPSSGGSYPCRDGHDVCADRPRGRCWHRQPGHECRYCPTDSAPPDTNQTLGLARDVDIAAELEARGWTSHVDDDGRRTLVAPDRP